MKVLVVCKSRPYLSLPMLFANSKIGEGGDSVNVSVSGLRVGSGEVRNGSEEVRKVELMG